MKKKQSARARRMERRHRRNITATISLVAMVDIVTILVFFLLVNTTSNTELPNNKLLQLPQSMSEVPPEQQIVLMVTTKDVIVQGHPVIATEDVLSGTEATVPALTAELVFQASKTKPTLNASGVEERSITVMADRTIPYDVLKKIMVTCSANNYSKISLAVLQREEKAGS